MIAIKRRTKILLIVIPIVLLVETIVGCNHAYFRLYGEQKGDHHVTITRSDQQ